MVFFQFGCFASLVAKSNLFFGVTKWTETFGSTFDEWYNVLLDLGKRMRKSTVCMFLSVGSLCTTFLLTGIWDERLCCIDEKQIDR